jgi:hypothetical protein
MRRSLTLLSAIAVAVLASAITPATAGAQTITGGPVVLMGIDAEDGGPGGHGPPATYTNIVNNINAQVTKTGTTQTLLVIGCNKSLGDNVSTFWNTVFPPHICVNGAAISTVNFAAFRMIAVVSDVLNTPSGGLTCSGSTSEDARLDARAADIAAHVNAGGGLLGFSSSCPNPYGYVGTLGTFSISTVPDYPTIDPTPAGLVLGVNDSLDVCCWHQIFNTFPSFLQILAYRGGTQDPAAVGGRQVIIIPREPATLTLTPAADTNPVGTEHCVTATVRDQFGDPLPGVTVRFSVTGSVSDSGSATTNASGQATFCYDGPTAPGADMIHAFADTDNDSTQDTGEPFGDATKTWVAGPPATLTLDPVADTNPVDTEHCVTATVRDAFGNPVSGVTVRFSVTGSVMTSGSATTDANGEAEFCYDGPPLPGADAIHAYADTDNDSTQDAGEPFGDATKTWVLPVSTPGCEVKITNGGWIIANNGDRASFGGNAKVDLDGNVSGNEEYQDHGPAQPMNLHGNVLAIICHSATEASIYGKATIDGSGSHFYRIKVRDLAEPGKGMDTYEMLVDTGYYSGDKTLEGGNVQIHRS